MTPKDDVVSAGSVPWDGYALEELARYAATLKVKAEEISRRCNLSTVTDYIVKMAIRELADYGTEEYKRRLHEEK